MRPLIQQRKYFYVFSGVLVFMSITALSLWGLKLGIDFRGGTLLEVSWGEEDVLDQSVIEKTLSDVPGVSSLVIQPSGERNVLIRYASSDEGINEAVLSELRKQDPAVELVRSEFVGPSVSDGIKKNAIVALFLAVAGIILYIAWAFRGISRPVSSWHYGVQATIALAHDIVITLGVFSFLGRFYDVEVGASFIAALLTILGYSVNDTIVVYDRIRENLIRSDGKEDFESVANVSLNQTLARSFNTSFTVIIVLIAISVLGGESIRSFSIALLVGVTAGTYSSIYIATALLVTGNVFRERREARLASISENNGKHPPKRSRKLKNRGDSSGIQGTSSGSVDDIVKSASVSPSLSEKKYPAQNHASGSSERTRKKKRSRRRH